MRDHLCEGPIEIAGVRADDLDGVVAGLAHGGGRQMRFQPDRQPAIRLIVSVDQIGWRMWLIGDPVHQRGAERRHRLSPEERRVGKERASTCRYRGWPSHKKK